VIKEGDYVIVVSGAYNWTVPGSWGRVIRAIKGQRTVMVEFEFVNQPQVISMNQFVIETKHLAPLTKLHKLLYGIEHV
jgi:ribosomal protein L24